VLWLNGSPLTYEAAVEALARYKLPLDVAIYESSQEQRGKPQRELPGQQDLNGRKLGTDYHLLRCRHLIDENGNEVTVWTPGLKTRCAIYASRPELCREFPTPYAWRDERCGYSFVKIAETQIAGA
jgi:Fe-S-cluster containining protein